MSQPTTTQPVPFCFVLMPFSSEFEDVYQIGIKEACASAGAYCERVDEQIFHESILSRIYNQIAKADFIVADMTGRNPNVFYEVGYAHALGKPTVLLTQNTKDIPFDLQHFPHIIYCNGIAKLRTDLTRHIQYFVDNPSVASTDTRIGIVLYLDGSIALSDDEAVFDARPGKLPHFKLSIHNSSFETLSPGAFRIGVITNQSLARCGNKGAESTALPTGEVLHMLPQFDTLLPDAYTSCEPFFKNDYGGSPAPNEEHVVVRLYTARGSRDFKVLLRPVPK